MKEKEKTEYYTSQMAGGAQMKFSKNILVVLTVVGLMLAAIQPCWAGGRYHGGYHHGRGGGISTGAAIGIGLGALALGTAVGVFSQPSCYPSQPRWVEVWETQWRQEWDPWRRCWVNVPYRVRNVVPVY